MSKLTIGSMGIRERQEYRISAGWAAVLVLGGLAFLGFGLFAAYYVPFVEHPEGTKTWKLFFSLAMLGIAGLGVACLRMGLVARIALYADRFEYKWGFGAKAIHRDDIGALRIPQPGVMSILAKDGKSTLLTMQLAYKVDDDFHAWFEGISNLSAEEAEKEVEGVRADETLGRTPGERLQRLEVLQTKVLRPLFWGCLAAFAWVAFYPAPYLLAIGVNAAIPLLAIGALRLGIVPLHNGQARGGLEPFIMLPGFALSLRAVSDSQLVDATGLVVPTLIGTLLFWVVVRKFAKGSTHSKLALLALLFAVYPASLSAVLNQELDGSEGRDYQVRVLSKHESDETKRVEFSPGGPWTRNHDLPVGQLHYKELNVGDNSCLRIRSGALGLRWWAIADECR